MASEMVDGLKVLKLWAKSWVQVLCCFRFQQPKYKDTCSRRRWAKDEVLGGVVQLPVAKNKSINK